MRQLIEWVFEAASGDQFSVIARDQDEAFYKAEQEAGFRNLHDARLRLVDECPHDPSGGDGPED